MSHIKIGSIFKMEEYEDKVDEIELMEWIKIYVPVFGNKKLKWTHHGVYTLLQHPHKLVRWLTVLYSNKRFVPIIEYHYYQEKKEVVRKVIIEKTKNINLLVYAMFNDEHEQIKKIAFRKYAHLIGGKE